MNYLKINFKLIFIYNSWDIQLNFYSDIKSINFYSNKKLNSDIVIINSKITFFI